MLSKETTTLRRKAYKETHPLFTKTDLAKYENTWDQMPYFVSEGAQKNFKKFTIRLAERGNFVPDAKYYERLIAKAILFRKTEKLVQQQQYGGYRANIVTYTIASLRIAVPFEREEIVRIQNTLEESKGALELEQRFMSQDLYNDLMDAVSNFEKVFTMTFQNPKVSRIAEIISSKKYSSICIVIADKLDKMRCEAYWRNYGVRKHSPTVVRVLYPQEYANSDTVRCDATIVVGWLNSKNMKNVIYCYGSSEYTILTYACEEKWRIAHTRSWNKSLSNSSNHRLVRNSFSKKSHTPISDERFVEKVPESRQTTFDELGDIETLIQHNTYRQYGVSANGQDQIVDAYPINFVGGYLAFYKAGHKIITVRFWLKADSFSTTKRMTCSQFPLRFGL